MRRPLKQKHEITPDYAFNSKKVARFINYIMRDGKKTVAERILHDAFDVIEKKTGDKPLEVFESALENVSPKMEVRSRRVGGANYQIPYEVRPERQAALSMRWILESARSRKGTPMNKALAEELIAASKKEGEAIKKREMMHRMAEANKAFAHFAFTGKKKKKS